MKNLYHLSLLIIACIFLASTANGQSKGKVRKIEYNSAYNYEVSTVAVGVDGTKLVKVWGYGKKPEDAIRKAKMDAVACAIFKGYPASGGGRAAKTPAIVTDADALSKNEAFFTSFFQVGGKYLQYVNQSTDAPPSGADRIKMKKGYKVGVTLSIAFDDLRKYLEDEGIARKLDAGF